MAVGDLVVQDYQLEYRGLLLGPDTVYGIRTADILNLPAVRSSWVDRPRDHGQLAGPNFTSGRQFAVEIEVHAGTDAGFAAAVAALWAATADFDTLDPLVFRLPGEAKRRIHCVPLDRRDPVTLRRSLGRMADVAMLFGAPDPRIYANDETSANLTLPTATGGLDWPVAWPLGWGSASSGLVTATNAGTFPTRPVVTFNGPLTAPSLENVTTGETWDTTFDLPAATTLVVDFDARTVLLGGTASRYSFVKSTSVWWELQPGANSLRLGAAAGSGSADVAFRSAWM